MAKNTYYALDPKSSGEIILDDGSGTPNTEVLSFFSDAVYDPITRSLVGCGYGMIWATEQREIMFTIALEIQSMTMEDVWSKIAELENALKGDQSIPGGDKRFDLKVAHDGGTYYGWKKCFRKGFLTNFRPYHRVGGVDYPVLTPPYFTVVTITASTKYTELLEL